jgi:PRTRC genetic system protein C
MVEVTRLTRTFTYNGATLPDPDPQMPVDMVKEFYATQYPELATAGVEGPKAEGERIVFNFSRAIGTKG